MCNVCGLNCARGGGLKKHLEAKHEINYEQYRRCFYDGVRTILADSWNDDVSASKKNGEKRTVMVHVLVRRFVGSPGPRGVRREN